MTLVAKRLLSIIPGNNRPHTCTAKARLIASLLFILVLASISGCQPEPVKQAYSGFTMGTSYHVAVLNRDLGAAIPADLGEQLQQRLNALDQVFSTYKPDSEISRINAVEPGQPLSISPDMAKVLRLSHEIYTATGGAFNSAVGPLVDLWGFGPQAEPETLPEPAAIAEKLKQVNFSQLAIDQTQRTITKHNPLRIDLSAVAKGYAVDQLAGLLQAHGITHYLVEVGGELRLSGLNAQNQPWRIGVERPSLERSDAQKVVALTNMALATSGDYRNYIERDGVRYSHTIDPRTGQPIRNRLASVTVITSDAATADALATAFMVMGEQATLAYANQQNIAVYLIVKEGEGFREVQNAFFEHINKIKQNTE